MKAALQGGLHRFVPVEAVKSCRNPATSLDKNTTHPIFGDINLRWLIRFLTPQ
jgi:hypothetical protein